MTFKRQHLWVLTALIAGFAIGVYYSKNSAGSLVLSGVPLNVTNTGGMVATGTNGTASIPVFGMVTAAQGVAGNGVN